MDNFTHYTVTTTTISTILASTGYRLRFYAPLNTKSVISETFPKTISWLDMEKNT